jgi:hypothetical protein
MYFTKTKNTNKYWYELLEDAPDSAMHKANLISNLRKSGKITDVTTDDIVGKILEYAKDLRA